MNRYFFDTADGERDTDSEGTEFASDDKAVIATIKFAGGLIRDEPSLLENSPELMITARTIDDRVIARVRVELHRT